MISWATRLLFGRTAGDDARAESEEGYWGQFPIPMMPNVEVARFLEASNGSAWQGDIEVEMGWSASKTSRTLSQMETNGLVTRYQIGRRKVVCLPGNGPEQVRVVAG